MNYDFIQIYLTQRCRGAKPQSLINEPEIVFLDEPMSGLDPIGRREIRELIAELREQGTTIFMSTHILSDIEALYDNVAILRKGKLAATGKLDDLLSQSGETQQFEIVLKGVSAENLREKIANIAGAVISAKANGANIQVTDEDDKNAGGSLVFVQPVKQSLEELFIKETGN